MWLGQIELKLQRSSLALNGLVVVVSGLDDLVVKGDSSFIEERDASDVEFDKVLEVGVCEDGQFGQDLKLECD